MSAFKRITKSDVVTVPYVANKQWDFSHLTMASSSIYLYTGVKMTGSFQPATEPMTANSQYQRLVYDNINHQFYHNYSGSFIDNTTLLQGDNYESASIYRASGSYVEGLDISYGHSEFPSAPGSTISVLNIPTAVYGEALKPTSFVLSSSAYYITDDGYGNLNDSNGTFVGNVFYPYGIAVITNQAYQSYFTDTTTVPIFWNNFNTPGGFFIDGDLSISVNGVQKVLSYADESGRFTANVGDTITIDSWSDGTWPSFGTASLHLTTTGQAPASSSVSGAHLGSSFTLSDQTPIYINSYTDFVDDIKPYTIIWSLAEYTESGSIKIDDSLYIANASYSTYYVSQSTTNTGTAIIPATQLLRMGSVSQTSSPGSTWGSYLTASLYLSLYQDSTLIASNYAELHNDAGAISKEILPTLTPGSTYRLYGSTGNPIAPPTPATIYWSLNEYQEPGIVFLDGNFRVQTPGGGTVYIDQYLGGSGSFTIPAGTTVEVPASIFTNDGDSVWNRFVSASLDTYVTHSSVVVSTEHLLVGRNTGGQSATATPSFTVAAGESYYVNVSTKPTLMPISMSYSSAAVGGPGSIIDNNARYDNGITGVWYMGWDRTLLSGQTQPEDSTIAPFAYGGQVFTAVSSADGPGSTWGAFTSCNTNIDVYENGVLIASDSKQVVAAGNPSGGTWHVYASASFVPVLGRTYVLNAYNNNLASGSVPPPPPPPTNYYYFGNFTPDCAGFTSTGVVRSDVPLADWTRLVSGGYLFIQHAVSGPGYNYISDNTQNPSCGY